MAALLLAGENQAGGGILLASLPQQFDQRVRQGDGPLYVVQWMRKPWYPDPEDEDTRTNGKSSGSHEQTPTHP
ncbi:MAG TPA: hypothetical protein VFE27_05550 [Acidobacteriaceae bacterium]|nr:hypothetical protein [Acidobacteriaceae bacterium]